MSKRLSEHNERMLNRGSCPLWLLSVLVVACAFGQQKTQMQLVVQVDGSVNPGRIPDDLAWRHFLCAVASHSSPTAAESSRQKAQLAPLGLPAADSQLLTIELGRMQTQLDAIQSSLQLTNPGDSAARTALKQQSDELMAQTILKVNSILSPDGLSLLRTYITNTVKRNIVIYGTPK